METIQIENSIRTYAGQVLSQTAESNWKDLSEIIATLINAKERGSKIFTVGNGGSSSTASHMANDFLKGCRVHNREGFNIECLADSNAIVTCLGNDFSYEDIFSIQLKTKAKAGDVLVCYSGSGNSGNLVRAAETAKNMGMITVGFLGRDGGVLKQLCDYSVIAPSDVMEQIEDMHMLYEHTMATVIKNLLEDRWGMEVVSYPAADMQFRYALFDFDGTISLIREGWQEIMIPYFIEVLKETPQAESEKEIEEIVTTFVDRLTGKQTIFQCMQLDEEVIKRGGKKENPGVYKAEYLRRLMIHIKDRLTELKNGCDPEKYLVPGSIELVKALKKAGYHLYLASGTDEEDVFEEARLLGLEQYFETGIHGAHADQTACSKEMVIRDILETKGLTGKELVSFGDGFVEIELVKNIGGYPIGVATDEVRKKELTREKEDVFWKQAQQQLYQISQKFRRLLSFWKREEKKMPYPIFDRSKLIVKPIAERQSDVFIKNFKKFGEPLEPFENPALPILADAIVNARKQDATVLMMYGAHVIRTGCGMHMIEMMKHGMITHFATNGAGSIHDFEMALRGETCESVARYVSEGQFGLWQECGIINDVIHEGVKEGLGWGEALGRYIWENNLPNRESSVLAMGYHLGVPCTVHIGVGNDIIHEHPNCDGAAMGEASYTDFLVYAQSITGLEHGVFLNFGSAVAGPEVYLKALTMARNVAMQEGKKITDFTTAVFDVQDLGTAPVSETPAKSNPRYYFRPWKTILSRTVADGGTSYYVQGEHRLTFPHLAEQVLAKL